MLHEDMYISGKNYVNGNDNYKNSSCGFFLGEAGKYNLYGVHRVFH